MRRWLLGVVCAALAAAAPVAVRTATAQAAAAPDAMIVDGDIGRSGGTLVVAARAEPKTFNPIAALDIPSRDVIWRMQADLIHINRETQRAEPALARSWTVSPDGLHYVLSLRRGVRFSDGHPFDADDVVFSFNAYLDERLHAAQRDLLLVGGKPIAVRKIDSMTIGVDLPGPYAAAERLFDSIAILPRHRLEAPWKAGTLADAWGLGTAPAEIVGLGPFRLERFRPGEDIVLARNANYWKQDRAHTPLPYLAQLIFAIVPSEDAQVVRLRAGELDVLNRVSSQHAATLDRDQASAPYVLRDLGPGLESHFLFFHQDDCPAPEHPRPASSRRARPRSRPTASARSSAAPASRRTTTAAASVTSSSATTKSPRSTSRSRAVRRPKVRSKDRRPRSRPTRPSSEPVASGAGSGARGRERSEHQAATNTLTIAT